MIRPARTLLWVSTLFAITLSGFTNAQVDTDVASSALVRIQCKFDDGAVMVSTGFSWNDKLHVVTALHAVAGCTSIKVKKEGGKLSLAEIKRVSLEGDLAYLQLDKDIGLSPAQAVTETPNMRGDFITWGYPHGISISTDVQTDFAGGQKRGAEKLKMFRGVELLDGLFETQNYPQRDTLVFRVTSTLQPGQSGAPILNADGLVVAIADGGLLGGMSGINWSIPAHIYLKQLLNSQDQIPDERSAWAALMSKVKGAPSGMESEAMASDWTNPGSDEELRYVSTIPFGMFADYKASLDDNDPREDDIIQHHFDYPGAFDHLAFEVFEDTYTGATISIPTGADINVEWDSELGLLFAYTPSGTYKMVAGAMAYDSFYEVTEFGVSGFFSQFYDIAEWDTPPEEMQMEFDSELEWGYGNAIFRGIDAATGVPIVLEMKIRVSGNQMFGIAFIESENPDDAPEEEYIASYMMYWSMDDISGFAEN